MGFCEFLSESPLGNVGLGVWQSGCAASRGFHVYKGAFAPLLGFSLYRTSCTLPRTYSSVSSNLDPRPLSLDSVPVLELRRYLSLVLDSCPCPRFACSWLDTWSP